MLYTRKISSIEEVNHLLQGGVKGGRGLAGEQLYVHGKTLHFTAPAATVTFSSGGAQVPLSVKDMLAQIASGTSNAVTAKLSKGGELLLRLTAGGTLTLKKDGTANALLGLSTTQDYTGKVYNAPGGGAPEFITIEAVPTCEDTFVVITNE